MAAIEFEVDSNSFFIVSYAFISKLVELYNIYIE